MRAIVFLSVFAFLFNNGLGSPVPETSNLDVQNLTDISESVGKSPQSEFNIHNKLFANKDHSTSHQEETMQRKREILPLNTMNIENYSRQKRALIFRPLFVYRQQEIKRQRIKERRKMTRPRPKNPSRNG